MNRASPWQRSGYAALGLVLACGARTDLGSAPETRRVVERDPVSVCDAAHFDLEPRALSLALLVDASSNVMGSEWSNAEWDTIAGTLKDFFESAAHENTSASLTLFPRSSADGLSVSCDSSNYQATDLGETTLPSTAFHDLLDSAGTRSQPSDDVPTSAAVTGAIEALERRAGSAEVALILVSAGLFHGCSEVLPEHEQRTNLRIYVVGVGEWLADAPNAPWVFSEWGAAPRPATTNVLNDAFALRVALERFWLRARDCSLALPPGASAPDPPALWLGDEVSTTPFTHDPSCTEPRGFHIDTEARVVELCPRACDAAATQLAQGQRRFRLGTACPAR